MPLMSNHVARNTGSEGTVRSPAGLDKGSVRALECAGFSPSGSPLSLHVSSKGYDRNANDQPTRQRRTRQGRLQDQVAGAAVEPPEARRLHARLHLDSEEAELGAPQGCPRPSDQRGRSNDLHPGRRTQPPGALDRAHPRRPCQRPAGSSLSRHSRHPRHGRGRQADAEPLEVRGQAAEEGLIQMPRRREVPKREILPDPVYNSQLVTKFINSLMSQGRKSVAERVFYSALKKVEDRAKDDPIKLFKKAVDNVKPALEVKSRRVGGSNYQVPIEVRPSRRTALAIRWLISYANSRGEKTMMDKLAGEIMDAANNRGNAIKKKEDTHKMAEANKAFAHYRW